MIALPPRMSDGPRHCAYMIAINGSSMPSRRSSLETGDIIVWRYYRPTLSSDFKVYFYSINTVSVSLEEYHQPSISRSVGNTDSTCQYVSQYIELAARHEQAFHM
jgi:hypothetical protein